jgi:hypothetical protein
MTSKSVLLKSFFFTVGRNTKWIRIFLLFSVFLLLFNCVLQLHTLAAYVSSSLLLPQIHYIYSISSPNNNNNNNSSNNNNNNSNYNFWGDAALLNRAIQLHTPPSTAFQQSNQSNNQATTSNKLNEKSCIKPRPVSWEWNRYSKNTTNTTGNNKRLLIGLFSGFDKYARILELTAPINKAYASEWNHDLVVLQGTAYILPIDGNCTPPGRRVTLNKIMLLRMALRKRDRYDQLLLLDTDAMMYDMTRDVTTLLPPGDDNIMLTAERVKLADPLATWNINAGVMLWNLHHPLTTAVCSDWDKHVTRDINKNNFHGDQYPLQKLLQKRDLRSKVHSVIEEFAYGHGTVVKHFIRRKKHQEWNDPNILDEREEKIKKVSKDLCEKYKHFCASIEKVEYSKL